MTLKRYIWYKDTPVKEHDGCFNEAVKLVLAVLLASAAIWIGGAWVL